MDASHSEARDSMDIMRIVDVGFFHKAKRSLFVLYCPYKRASCAVHFTSLHFSRRRWLKRTFRENVIKNAIFRGFLFCLNLTANTINPRLTGELPSSFVDRYPPLVHLLPFRSLLFYRFLFLQPKHYMLQDPGELSKMKNTTWVENYPTKNR